MQYQPYFTQSRKTVVRALIKQEKIARTMPKMPSRRNEQSKTQRCYRFAQRPLQQSEEEALTSQQRNKILASKLRELGIAPETLV